MNAAALLLVLLIAIASLAEFARRRDIPYPIMLVLGGLALGFVPGLPHIDLQPDLIFLLFLPPLLYNAAWSTSWRDFKANLRPIGFLAVGLVLMTTVTVAVVAHLIVPGLPWAAAFALGAIVSPPDAIAATAISQRLGLPHRLVTVIEGESLVNDASGLVAYQFAIVAVVTGTFSLINAGWQFVLMSAGGIALGIGFGWLTVQIEKRIENAPIEIIASFATPFAAYLAAEELHLSGVLAVVAAGLLAGRFSSRTFSALSRLQSTVVWDTMIFILNGFIFILIGLQLPTIWGALRVGSVWSVLAYAGAICLTVVVTRFGWIFPATFLPPLVGFSLWKDGFRPSWQAVLVLSWSGMRGVVSLAAALALPLVTDLGQPFPERNLIIFLTFSVILFTLVVQGLSLPPLIKRLGIRPDDTFQREERLARQTAAQVGSERLKVLADGYPELREQLIAMSARLGEIQSYFEDETPIETRDDDTKRMHTLRQITQDIVAAERAAVIALRDRRAISDDVLRLLERELDLLEVRLEP